jgi:hypothetical protein
MIYTNSQMQTFESHKSHGLSKAKLWNAILKFILDMDFEMAH